MNPWIRWFLKGELSYKLFRHLPPESDPKTFPPPLAADRLKIGAVQWNAEPVSHAADWIIRVERLFMEAKQANCHMVVFPEYLPLSLLGVIVTDNSALHTLTDGTISSMLRTLAPLTYRFWLRWMQALSRKYQMITVAGSGLTLERGRLLNRVVIIDSTGKIRGSQPKVHLLPNEKRWGIQSGHGFAGQPLAPMGLSAVVCNDATYFETFRILASQGASIVAVPIADPESRYTQGKARRGSFSRVQDVPMVGVVAAATGNLFGLRLTGKAGIYLPAPLTSGNNGVVAESPLIVGEDLVTGVVSLAALRQYQTAYAAEHPVPPADFMTALYQCKEDI